MSTITIKGAVFYDTDVRETDKFRFFTGINQAFSTYLPVCPHEITVDIGDFNPMASEVHALHRQEQELRDQFNAAVGRIHRRISELQAIEYSPAEVQS